MSFAPLPFVSKPAIPHLRRGYNAVLRGEEQMVVNGAAMCRGFGFELSDDLESVQDHAQ